eukprot:m.151008 g.151008  ORF g.151008 m.151008 type:complete len:73 (+) comp14241_c0_seq6:113-331(+)
MQWFDSCSILIQKLQYMLFSSGAWHKLHVTQVILKSRSKVNPVKQFAQDVAQTVGKALCLLANVLKQDRPIV